MSRTKTSLRRGKRSMDEKAVDTISKKKPRQKETSEHLSTTPECVKEEKKGSYEWAQRVFRTLLGGMSLDTFEAMYFEKKPLHVRKVQKGALFRTNLFSRKKMLTIMEKEMRSMSFGNDLTVCRYRNSKRENFHGEDSNGHATSRQVANLFDQGFSCQFYQPQRYVDELYEIIVAFEEIFGSLAGASAYLTPAKSQALAPHHDDIEAFVLQTQGRKKWKLYHPQVELAGEYSSDLAADQLGEPWMEMTLEEGDMLYFPRGVVHQACTDENQFSTHITISVYQHNTWANYLEVALPRVIRQAFDSDVIFRKGLPLRYLSYMGTQFPSDSTKAKDFTVIVKKLVGQLAAHVGEKDLQEASDVAAMDVVANRLPPPRETTNDKCSLSPLEENVTICFRNRSHVRLSVGEDEMKEAFVALYYSHHNCRRHHMGVCTCDGGDKESKEDVEDDDSGETGENAESGSADEDLDDGENGSEDDENDPSIAFGQLPPQPKSIVFPGELAPALMKLYASSAPTMHGALIGELAEAVNDKLAAVHGMLLRLWSEGLLDVSRKL